MSMSPLLGHCNVLVEVVGEFLALLITLPAVRDEAKFFLVRWNVFRNYDSTLSHQNGEPTRLLHCS
jgi:hypothetical protein